MPTLNWRAVAASTMIAVVGLAACGDDASGKPNPKVFVGKLKTTGRATIVTVISDVQPGEIACGTPKMDDDKEIATYSCTTKTNSGAEVTLTGSSTYAQLEKKEKGKFEGTIVIALDGVEKLSTTCVGKLCPDA